MEEKSHFLKKIRIDKYALKAVLHCPPDISLFGDIVHDKDLCASHYDFIFVFIYSLSEFHEHVLRVIREERLNAGGVLFLLIPRKAINNIKRILVVTIFLILLGWTMKAMYNSLLSSLIVW